ncbi:MAG TPA: M1 family aminopeptidase [Edaphobacter sp.]
MQKQLILVALTVLALTTSAFAQTPTPPEPEQQPPAGTVIHHRSADEPQQTTESPSSSSSSNPTAIHYDADLIPPTDAERSSLLITAWTLDLHLAPASSHLAAHAGFTVRNTGPAPLPRIALQLSSALHWDSISLRTSNGIHPLTFAQHLIDTAVDHTGQASETIITLPEPLAPNASVDLSAVYSGEITASTKRLERIGASPEDAAFADWDAITPSLTALRGFGNVLWYPVASAAALNNNQSSLGLARLRQSTANFRLRLAVEYQGEPPAAAYFSGRREVLHAVPEDAGALATDATGIATADFPARPVGFRFPSLFVVPTHTTATDNMLIAAVSTHPDVLPSYNAASQLVRQLLAEWLGPNPLEPLTLIDHEGQPFEDNALVIVPMQANDAAALAPALTHSLTHAWFHSSLPWLNEGVPQFLTLLWIEHNNGRDAALSLLDRQINAVALAEPQIKDAGENTSQSLIDARDEVYYAAKSAAVLWMLRSLAGDAALKHTLALYRDTVARNPKDEDAHLFQRLLEETSHKDLTWFFNDWVYRDRGLPDLSIVNVTPRDLSTAGRTSWLVAVEVRNDGYAAAEVPITVRSGKLTKTEYLRLPGRSTASTRILFEGVPEEVQVNDGTIPELTTPTHTQKLTIPAQAP